MGTPEERREILEMVASGKISASEGAALLAEMTAAAPDDNNKEMQVEVEGEAEAAVTPEAPEKKQGARGRWMNIHVDDLHTGKDKVRVRIPLGLVKFGLRMGGGFSPHLRDIDLEDLSDSVGDGQRGLLVDVEDEADGKHVQIFVD